MTQDAFDAAVTGIGPAGEINARDWHCCERLIDERGIVIDRPRGQAHPPIRTCVNPSRGEADDTVAFLDRGDPRPDRHLVWREPAP